MLIVRHCKTLVRNKNTHKNDIRYISKYLDKDKTSKAVRQRFLDYFINDNSHHFVRSSPVVPYCDPTVAFVNAGMNQFKGIFLGTQSPAYMRVANSQKCVRVGGKHNDLSIVGADGSHHTFSKCWEIGHSEIILREACALAWKLLTDVYKINKKTLYVTYFNGDEKLGLKPDIECKEIWRSIGVDEERILPFGMKDNFWEMGPSGPCGPCTEIHVDQRGNLNGTIMQLPKGYVDTGMGLERLCAVLQRRLSNYDTDLFLPMFVAIQKICKGIPRYNGVFGEKDWNGLQTSYRILADHTRMLTACLADGMIPEEKACCSQKLRRIMRKAFSVSELSFGKETGLVKELVNYVVESLGGVYVEMEKNINQVRQIIDYEEELYKSLRSTAAIEWSKIVQEQPLLADLEVLEMPGLVTAYKDIKNNNVKEITSSFSFKLYDTYGLDENAISKLSKALNITYDEKLLQKALDLSKNVNRMIDSDEKEGLIKRLKEMKIEPTVDHYKYKYTRKNNTYVFGSLPTKVIRLMKDNQFIDSIEPDVECNVIFDKTLLYHEAGGQASDKGHAVNNSGIFQIDAIEDLNGVLLHRGRFKSDSRLAVGDRLVMKLDENNRLGNMRNHTATHLLNAALRDLKGVTCQKSSKVDCKRLNFDVGIFGEKLSVSDVRLLEGEINRVINIGLNVKITEIDSQELLLSDNVTLIPGETYPDTGIRLVEIVGNDFTSREPCCGTHVYNTADIADFCITNTKSLGRSTISIHAITGSIAQQARNNGTAVEEKIMELQKV
ncbi:alanyl-trna synthetase [Holotrichia oblita]|uniref:Alanyl-trna synthetase n=1 Tax=Holotrichia oblita TaxID=644536 RepID=A0ACB9TJC6_HOLOL|nr:alanyl-trna synthetase [Holotrichia oblita]